MVPESNLALHGLHPLMPKQIGPIRSSLLPHLTEQLRWHKTLSRLYKYPSSDIDQFLTIGRGARGLGIMLRGELKQRPKDSEAVVVQEFGVKQGESERDVRLRRGMS